MREARRFSARVRRRLARLAWRATLGSVAGDIPRRYVRSIVEKAEPGLVADHIESISLLAAASVEYFAFDSTLPAEFRRSKAFDDRYVYRLRDVCVSARTGLCWFPGGPVLEESFGSLIRMLGWGAATLEEPLVGARRVLEGPVVVLAQDGYFHWLLEALPAALHALDHVADATLLLPATAPSYVDEAVEVLGLRNVVRADDPVRAEHLVLAARDPFSGFVRREDIEILRRTFLPLVGAGTDEALYVSRRLQQRSPANEAELERVLAGHGFRVVMSEALSFPAQVGLFAGADVVAGTHGAGLANLVWSQPSSVAEVFVSGHFNDCYARLAVTLEGTYRPFYCTTTPAPWGSAPIEQIAAVVAGASAVARGDGG